MNPYAGYMLVRPLRLPFAGPWIDLSLSFYVVGPVLLALCFLIPAAGLRPDQNAHFLGEK